MRIIILFTFLIFSLKANAQLPNLTLEDAINVALKNNFGIQIGQNDAAIARNNVTKGNAGFEPNLNLVVTENPSMGFLNQKLGNGTEANRTNFLVVVIGLLIVATVIPMATWWWYQNQS